MCKVRSLITLKNDLYIKKFLLGVLILLSPFVCLMSCSDEDAPTIDWEEVLDNMNADYSFDEQGRCYGVGAVSESDFYEYIAAHGWKHQSSREIDENGKCATEEFYGKLLGGSSPSNYYISADNWITRYCISDADAQK